jgi:hypothetical protein
MSDAVAVGLITSVSTLIAVGLTGVVSAWISRSQLRHQATLSAAERTEQRADRQREMRREAYLRFLTRLDEAYRRLDERWTAAPPREPALPRSDPAYAALRALDEAHNGVLLEGPHDVAEQAELIVNSVNAEYRGQRRLLASHAGAQQGTAQLAPADHAAAIAARVERSTRFIDEARRAIGGHRNEDWFQA